MATQTEQLERETERVRTDLSHTLDELRGRMTPGYVVDQVVDYARQGDGAAMVANLRRQTVENPLALSLIGIGLAWIMVPWRRTPTGTFNAAGRADQAIDAAGAVGDSVSNLANAAADRIGAQANAVSEASQQAGARLGKAGSQIAEAAGSASEAVSQGYDRAAGAATRVAGSISSAGHRVADSAASAQENFLAACKEQPLILAGVGLALGAAIGAAFPRTKQEDQLMGELSDSVKSTAAEFAKEKVETAEDVTHEAIGAVAETAQATAEKWRSAQTTPSESPSISPSREKDESVSPA